MFRDLFTPSDYKYNVVVAVPTLLYPVIEPSRSLRRRLRKGDDDDAVLERAEQFLVNEMMARWIMQEGHNRSISVELWYFDPALLDPLAAKVDALCGDYIIRHQLYASEMEAQQALNADPSIAAVYDADHERVDELWRFRGYRVPLGSTP